MRRDRLARPARRFFTGWGTLGLVAALVAGCAQFPGETPLTNSASDRNSSRPGWARLLQRATAPRDAASGPGQGGSGQQPASSATPKTANPPARTIRFDGHETVLGNGIAMMLAPDQLVEQLEELHGRGRSRSAGLAALQHADSAERLLRERWADGAASPAFQVIADAQTWRSHGQSGAGWNALLALAAQRPDVCQAYLRQRNQFAITLQRENPSDESARALTAAAGRVQHPLVTIDALRLQGLRCLLAEQADQAAGYYRQAAEHAESHNLLDQSSDLWLMVSESARRLHDQSTATAAWQRAVNTRATLLSREGVPVDPSFWDRADHLRPPQTPWPQALIMVLAKTTSEMGCRTTDAQGNCDSNRLTMALWAAVGWAQYQRGQPQLGLVSLKKAEQTADADNLPWLQIAQARCLGLLGQAPAASALLSGPVAHPEPEVRCAAMACLGSIKLHTGAYQQGASLLNKAITQTPGTLWPGRAQAEADLALARLILGETDAGLEALHRAQALLAQQRDWLGLVKSLENEARLLEHEKRKRDADQVRQRIAHLERAGAASPR